MTRRAFVVGGGVATGLTVVAGQEPQAADALAAFGSSTASKRSNALLQSDPTTLPIPPLLSPPLQDGEREFKLTLQVGQMEFEPGNAVETLGINGPYLGPTLRATRGDAVEFTVTNHIGEPTTLHWHGMHLPAMMDGGPHQEIADGGSWQPNWTINQQSATLFYHPHTMGSTREQVTRGAVGMFIVDDDNSAQAGLPHNYGIDDIPLILQEYRVRGGHLGQGQGGNRGGGGNNGILVNGALQPTLVSDQSRLRLRLLNATDDLIFSIGFVGDVPFSQVASDGGLLPASVQLTRLQLGVAERVEIVVDLTDAPSDSPLVLQEFGNGGDGQGPLMSIQGPGQPVTMPALPAILNIVTRFDPDAAAVIRPMVLGGGGGRGGDTTINGMSMTSTADMADMANTLMVQLGDLERWDVENKSDDTHMFHIHDVQFQIMNRNGVSPDPTETGFKDTVVVRPGETVPLLMRFEDYADPAMPYMFHCHILDHEDEGMMGQFVVMPT